MRANDWQMSPAFKAVDFQDDRIVWLAADVDLWFRAGSAAWPTTFKTA